MKNKTEEEKDLHRVDVLGLLNTLNWRVNSERPDGHKAVGLLRRTHDDGLIGVHCKCGKRHPVAQSDLVVLWNEEVKEQINQIVIEKRSCSCGKEITVEGQELCLSCFIAIDVPVWE